MTGPDPYQPAESGDAAEQEIPIRLADARAGIPATLTAIKAILESRPVPSTG